MAEQRPGAPGAQGAPSAPGASAQGAGAQRPPAQTFPPVDPSKFKLIGQNYVTQDLMAKVTGRAKYAEDFRAEGMLFAKLLLSPRPHARVTSLDTSRALAMPGVHAVLTYADLPKPAPPAGPGPAAGAVPSAAAAGGVPAAGAAANQQNQRAANAPPTGPGAAAAPGTPPSAAAVPPAQQAPQTPPLAPELALAEEAMYEGEPILAVAADSEELAAAAIEQIRVTFEPLDFCVDPLDSLRPGSANARRDGNVFVGGEVKTIKWTAEQYDRAKNGQFPTDAEAGATTVWGDVEKGFAQADVVVEHTQYQQSTSHQPLESRTAMAYWQNGKLYLHGSTQSVSRTVASVAGWVGVPQSNVVVISEYCGGGFGSKIPGAQTMAIPALLSKKLNGRPVMMRISREEETYIGRTRPGFQAWAKMGFKKDGTVVAVDAFIIEDSGPYRGQGDNAQAVNLATLLYQAPNARFRGLSVATNTPPRVSQRAPGGLQSALLFEPLVTKAARKLGVDEVQIRRMNAPVNGSPFGLNPVANATRPRTAKVTSSFVREALDRGAELFNWEERKKKNGQRNGSKVTGVGVSYSTFTAGSIGMDGLFVIKPDGKMYIHQGIGNLGTHSVMDTARVVAEVMEFPWEQVEVIWGNTSRGIAWSSIQAGSQTTLAHTRANYAAGAAGKKLAQELAAAELGGNPEGYRVGGRGVSGPGGSLTWAQLAERAIKRGGKFDGHEAPGDINAMTKLGVGMLAGQGFVAAARDTYPRDGQSYGFVAAFAEVEVDVETGVYHIVDYIAVADVGTVMNPRSLKGQILGGGLQGMGTLRSQKLVYDAHYGVAIGKRMYQNKPPTMLDIPINAHAEGLNIPDPGNPVVGAKGIGEPGIGAGGSSVLCALANALGNDELLMRTPVQPEQIMTSVQQGRPAYERMTAYI